MLNKTNINTERNNMKANTQTITVEFFRHDNAMSLIKTFNNITEAYTYLYDELDSVYYINSKSVKK